MTKSLRLIRRVLIILSLSVLLLLTDGIWAALGHAEVRHHEDVPGQMLYQSRQSMRDIDRHPWQVILFKRMIGSSGGNTTLRLVGFPAQIEFQHPQPLVIQTRTGQDFQASDQFADHVPALNVGQYDLTEILPLLPNDQPVMLVLPTTPQTIIKIPAAVVLEWRLVSSPKL